MVDRQDMQELLQRVADGALSVDEALTSLRSLPFEDLGFAKVDHHRAVRTGFSEVVYCEGKTPQQVAEIIASLAEHSGRVLGTRAARDHYEAAQQRVSDLHYDDSARAIWLDRDPDRARADGVVIVAAGTSDLPVAREAELTLDLLGCRAPIISDVGVAGVHRLLHHVKALQSATVLVVVAGMEGALPSVVAGLVAAPVIAVPTSVGYGASFHGVTALLAMLNSCATGVGVVNIDNGYGAACLAAMINRRAGQDRTPAGDHAP
jgi:pyridinium-3,5-biscarboxylic acid mononucleotide synthase